MDKISIYGDIIEREIEPTQNFLDGLLYIDEFSFFYELLNSLNFQYELIPSFKYNENRETLSETMREFKIRILDYNVVAEDIAKKLEDAYIDSKYKLECMACDNFLTIKLL